MKYTWLIWILIGLYFLIKKLIKKEKFKFKDESKFIIISIILYILLSLLIYFLNPKAKVYNYNKFSAERNRFENHIPCINSSMELVNRTYDEEIWINKIHYNSKKIQHYKKVVKIDFKGIYEEHDYFVNVDIDKALLLRTNMRSNIFRNTKTNHQLIDHVSLMDIYSTTKKVNLSSVQADSVLNSWDLKVDYDCYKN